MRRIALWWKRSSNRLTMTMLMFSISFFLMAMLVTAIRISHGQAANNFEKELGSLLWGLFISQAVALLFQLFSPKEETHCTYQEYLQDIGVDKVYENRENPTRVGSYIEDLLADLDCLSYEHLKSDSPIKMIGVSLEFYFSTDESKKGCEIAKRIAEISSNAFFRVLLCDTANEELKLRDVFTNQFKGATDSEHKADTAADIIRDIEVTRKRIRKLQTNKIEVRSYLYAPYVTMVILNRHIYYTPNMVYEKKGIFHSRRVQLQRGKIQTYLSA